MEEQKVPGRSKFATVRKVVSATLLAVALIALLLALRKPVPVAAPQSIAAVKENAQSFQAKVDQLAQASPADPAAVQDVHFTASEVGAAMAEATNAVEPKTPEQAPATNAAPGPRTEPTASPTPADALQNVNVGQPLITFDGDVVKGQFLSEVAGKNVYVTVAGRLGAKDGYATFEPTEFKIGDLKIPVSLVNDALQKKLSEQRDQLKLPDFVRDLRVENSELVVVRK